MKICTTDPHARRATIERAFEAARAVLNESDCAASDALRVAGILTMSLGDTVPGKPATDQDMENTVKVAMRMKETLYEGLNRGREEDLPLLLRALGTLLLTVAAEGDETRGIGDPLRG